jgi:hypothetical protein
MNHTDHDDTTVSVSMTMDSWTPFVSVLIACGIAACLIVRCFTDDSAKPLCHMCALVLAVLLLAVLLFVCYRRWAASQSSCSDCDGFSDFEWGYNGFEHKLWKADKRTHKIVGPDETNSEMRTWQYNPQNTLTDYRYFKTYGGNTHQKERLAPIARPRVGSYSGLPNIHIADNLGQVSTRNPDVNSTPAAYAQQHPASPLAFQSPVSPQ